MTVLQGVRYTDSDTENRAVDMSDTLSWLDPSEVPTLSLIGKTSIPVVSLKHEWLEDALRPLDGTLGGSDSMDTDAAATTMNVTSGQGTYIRAGDIIQIESEFVSVDATPAADAVTITRSYGAPAAATHADGTAWHIVGQATLQDAAVGAGRTTVKTNRFNYCQLYEDAIKVTTTEAAIKKYVEQNEMPAQLMRAMKVAWKTWNRSLLRGVISAAPTHAVAGTMNGIIPVVAGSGNAYAKSTAALTEAFILTAMQASWDVGGRIDTILCGPFQKRQMNTFLDSMRMTSRQDRTAGVVVDTYTSDFGQANIVLERDVPTDTVLLIDSSRIGFGPLTGFAMSAAPIAATTRLVDTVQIIGQYTSETRNALAHAVITGLTTS
jgi:hypothetical protein